METKLDRDFIMAIEHDEYLIFGSDPDLIDVVRTNATSVTDLQAAKVTDVLYYEMILSGYLK